MPITLYPQQGQFTGTQAHHAAFIGGIGSGKTTAGAVRALLASQGYIGQTKRLRTPNTGMIIAPTYTMLRDASLRTFEEVANGAIDRFQRSTMQMTLVNGSEVLWRSADAPDRLRGPNLTWVWLDEAALMSADVWPIMLGRLRQFGKQGYIWATTTPRGRNWLYTTFVRDHAADDDYKLVQASSFDNVHLDAAVLAGWQAAYQGDHARQELGGEFVSYEGMVYPEFSQARHVVPTLPENRAYAVGGIDFGYTNLSVVLVVSVDSDGRACVIAESAESQRHLDDLAAIALQYQTAYGVQQFYCDPAAPDSIAHIKEAGVRATRANNSVMTGIQAVKARWLSGGDGLPRLTVYAGCRNLLTELETYRWLHGAENTPLKRDDHSVDALRYAIMGLDKPDHKPLSASARRYW